MGLTNNLGKLSNMITSTGSAVGIAQPSPANTLDVTGTFRATGTTTLGGQIVSSNGSIVLQTTASNTVSTGNYIGFGAGGGTTSNNVIQGGVGQFLIFGYTGSAWITPLAISNSTGAATFSGNVGINTSPSYLLDISDATVGTFNTIAQFRNTDYTAGNRSFIRVRAQSTIGGSSSAYFGCGQDGNTYVIANNSARGGDLIIDAGTGAATFSKSIFINPSGAGSAVGDLTIRTLSQTAATTSQTAYDNARVRINTYYTSNIGLSIGYSGGNYNYLQSCYNEGTTAPLMLNPFGGNVNINTNTPNGYALNVNGSIYSSNAITSASNSGNSTRTQYGKAIPASSSVTFTFTAGGGNILGFNIIIGGYGGALTGWLGGTICGGGYMGYNSTIYNVVNNVTTSGALTVSISKSANSFAVIITNSAAATGSVYLTLDTTGDGLTIS